MGATYDTIGRSYSRRRATDPRIALAVERALNSCVSVLNVGAGTGSYEPRDCRVVALEPSLTMIMQRPLGSAPVVQGRAEALPFKARSFDAVLAILTAQHWGNQAAGFSECARVARSRAVFFTIDPMAFRGFWLFDYFPGLLSIDLEVFPSIERFADSFASIDVAPVPIPKDCSDGFLGAYWQRPGAYLDSLVRNSISTFSKLSARDLECGLARLRAELQSGEWEQRHARFRYRDSLDLGYRIVTCHVGLSA